MNSKKFKKEDLNVLQKIVGLKLSSIFKQLDMFILNWGEGIEFTLHTTSFIRIFSEQEIILTLNDEYFTPNYERLTKKAYNKDTLHRNSLLHKNLLKTKFLLDGAVVSKVEVSNIADVIITFNNGVKIEILTDCLWEDHEYFRFFEYKSFEEPHYVVSFKNKAIMLELVEISEEEFNFTKTAKYIKFKEKIEQKQKKIEEKSDKKVSKK